MSQEEGRAAPRGAEERIYILRVWRDGPGEPPGEAPSWHATVREGTQGLRRSFACIDDCLEHLYGELLRH